MVYNVQNLSRRERQIMDVLIAQGEASAQEVLEAIPHPPSYSSVRALIAKLVEKDQVAFRQEGAKYIYFVSQDMGAVRTGAMNRLVNTFFRGSAADAVTGLLDSHSAELSDAELAALEKKIALARKRSGETKE